MCGVTVVVLVPVMRRSSVSERRDGEDDTDSDEKMGSLAAAEAEGAAEGAGVPVRPWWVEWPVPLPVARSLA